MGDASGAAKVMKNGWLVKIALSFFGCSYSSRGSQEFLPFS